MIATGLKTKRTAEKNVFPLLHTHKCRDERALSHWMELYVMRTYHRSSVVGNMSANIVLSLNCVRFILIIWFHSLVPFGHWLATRHTPFAFFFFFWCCSLSLLFLLRKKHCVYSHAALNLLLCSTFLPLINGFGFFYVQNRFFCCFQ